MTMTDEHGHGRTDRDPVERRRLRRQRRPARSSYSPVHRRPTRPAVGLRERPTCSGTYSGQLTIAAENDIIVDGRHLTALRRTGMLGLIANNFVRVNHPFPTPDQCERQLRRQEQRRAARLTEPADRRRDPGDPALVHRRPLRLRRPLGTLTVNGAISQKFRGAVGTPAAAAPATSRTTTTTTACATWSRRTSSTRSSPPGTSSARRWTSRRLSRHRLAA